MDDGLSVFQSLMTPVSFSKFTLPNGNCSKVSNNKNNIGDDEDFTMPLIKSEVLLSTLALLSIISSHTLWKRNPPLLALQTDGSRNAQGLR